MRKIDYPLVFALFLAHIFLYITFHFDRLFWYTFPASMLLLIIFSIYFKKPLKKTVPFRLNLLIGSISGLLLYGLFWLGARLLGLFPWPFLQAVSNLYEQLSPTLLWHYVVLVLIIIPGEEIFWRGFVQERILKHFTPTLSIIAATILYTVPHLYSGSSLLVLAAIVGGAFWATLYSWKRSLPLVVISHLVFDLLLLIIVPLH